ncbi:ImmA/IrrE family metallo-endopeptidase [Patescibacteria group bacterium]|nr:ImmA/IrrE family metallo-endopeptidase [Patescibacteria group bacterium]
MQISYLSDEKIKKIANDFRAEFWGNSIPVEMEDIIELKLKIDIVQSIGLKYFHGIDMLIKSDFKSIYVDNNNYLDDTQKNRLRYSYAHEIGHFVLHKDIYKKFGIKNEEDLCAAQEKKSYQKNIKRIDRQAEIFAGHLLIPEERLRLERNQILESLNTKLLSKIKSVSKETLNQLLASQLSIIFGVSYMAMFIALDRIKT